MVLCTCVSALETCRYFALSSSRSKVVCKIIVQRAGGRAATTYVPHSEGYSPLYRHLQLLCSIITASNVVEAIIVNERKSLSISSMLCATMVPIMVSIPGESVEALKAGRSIPGRPSKKLNDDDDDDCASIEKTIEKTACEFPQYQFLVVHEY